MVQASSYGLYIRVLARVTDGPVALDLQGHHRRCRGGSMIAALLQLARGLPVDLVPLHLLVQRPEAIVDGGIDLDIEGYVLDYDWVLV